MSDGERPSWCSEPSCACLYSRVERLCYGRLAEKQLDEEFQIWNTHQSCCRGLYEQIQFNSADAYYEISGKILCLLDVLQHGLCNPLPEVGVTQPLKRLQSKLTGEN